ncbi:hypothetical protein PI86_09190 [Burkholderia sp. A9]|nr:hypothetical protein PI86_09190 [Burkholderia sp. A9]
MQRFEEKPRCFRMTRRFWYCAKNGCEIDWRNVARLQEFSLRRGKIEISDEVNASGFAAQLVTYPARPFEKVGIVTRESDEAQLVFDKNLSCQVHERSVFARIGPIVFFSKNEWSFVSYRSVQFNHTGRPRMRQICFQPYEIVSLIKTVFCGPFQ